MVNEVKIFNQNNCGILANSISKFYAVVVNCSANDKNFPSRSQLYCIRSLFRREFHYKSHHAVSNEKEYKLSATSCPYRVE